MPEPKQIIFKWEFALGHVIQIFVMGIAAIGIWYGLVADVERNRTAIAANVKSIEELRVANQQMLDTVNKNAERREERMMNYIGDIKKDLSWLVRREADRGVK